MRPTLLLCALLLTGCTASRSPFDGRANQPPVALADVNQRLARGQFRIERPGYVQPLEARHILIEVDSLIFRAPDALANTAVPITEVGRIYARQRIGVGEGALVGALPGVLLVTGVAVAYGGCNGWDCFGALIFGGAGVALAGLGALTGALVGTGYSSDWEVVYLGPAARDAPARAAPR